jgi:hypothetical protein
VADAIALVHLHVPAAYKFLQLSVTVILLVSNQYVPCLEMEGKGSVEAREMGDDPAATALVHQAGGGRRRGQAGYAAEEDVHPTPELTRTRSRRCHCG